MANTSNGRDLQSLPDEILTKILSFVPCSAEQYSDLSNVCRRLQDIVNQRSFRIEVARQQFPILAAIEDFQKTPDPAVMYGLAVKQQSVDEVFEKLSREDDGDTMKLYLWFGIHLLRYFCSLLSKDSVQNCALTVTTARLLRTDIAMALRHTMLRTTEFLQEVEGSFAKFEMPILTGQVTDEHEDKLRAVSIVIGDVNQVIRMRALEAAILCEGVVHDFADIFASEDSRIDLMMRMKFHMVTFRHTILGVFGISLAATSPATQLGYLNGLQCCLLSCWDLAARLQDSGGVEEYRDEVVVSRQLLENRELLIWVEILKSAESGDDCTVSRT